MEYSIKLYQIETEDGLEWVAKYIDFEGCVGGGKTKEEALKEAEENLVVYLETLEELGLPIPESKNQNKNSPSGKLSLRLPKSLHKELIEITEEEGCSINSFINAAISRQVGRINYQKDCLDKIENKFIHEQKGKVMKLFKKQISILSGGDFKWDITDSFKKQKLKMFN